VESESNLYAYKSYFYRNFAETSGGCAFITTRS